jgi:hypothetical protein
MDLERSREILKQVRVLLEPIIPTPAPLEDMPLELWLMRPVSIEVAADLLCMSPERVRKHHRDKLISIGSKRFLRLVDALLLGGGA